MREQPAPQARRQATALTAVTVTLGLWASAFVVIRVADRHLAPGALALARLLVGSVALGVVMLVRRQRLPSGRRTLGLAALSGVLWFAVYNLALNTGEQQLDPGTSSLLVNTGPIFIALLAGALLGERFRRTLIAGCVVAFAGTALIAIGASTRGVSELWAAVLCVLAAVAYAGGVVAQKPALENTSALAITWVACTVGAVSLLGFAPELASQLGRAPTATVAWTVYLGLGPTAIGFLFWAYALARTDAGRLGVTTYLVPPLVVLIGWAALGEVPPALAIPGGLMCLGGVAIARRR